MKRISLLENTIYSCVRSFLCIAFPLITLKYASVVLGADGLGEVEFAKSCVSYFLLLAALGIESLATRNGSGLKKDNASLKKFAGSVFSLNCITALIALVFLGITMCCVKQFKDNYLLILIFSTQIPLALLGVEWIYYIFEDFRYITLRTIICQIISLIILFIWVKDNTDVWKYALVLVLATYGANIWGFYNSRKYVKFKLVFNKYTFNYLPNALILFFNSLATTVYVNSDITMMGFLATEAEIGFYSTAVKIYTAIKTLVMAILNVSLPRLTYTYSNEDMKEYNKLISFVIKVFILIIPPCMIGVIALSEELILLVSGIDFINAVPSLIVLSCAILFSTVAMFCASVVLMPQKKEVLILKATVVGASANVVLNFILIPLVGCVGAALTTLISEFIVAIIQFKGAFKTIKAIKCELSRSIMVTFVGCIYIAVICMIIKEFSLFYLLEIMLAVPISIIGYFIIQIVFKTDITLSILKRIRLH